jgi:hypothetical protein
MDWRRFLGRAAAYFPSPFRASPAALFLPDSASKSLRFFAQILSKIPALFLLRFCSEFLRFFCSDFASNSAIFLLRFCSDFVCPLGEIFSASPRRRSLTFSTSCALSHGAALPLPPRKPLRDRGCL